MESWLTKWSGRNSEDELRWFAFLNRLPEKMEFRLDLTSCRGYKFKVFHLAMIFHFL